MESGTEKRSIPQVILEVSVLLTVLGGVAVLLRIAAVARGNLNTAFAIAHVSNPADILLSTLLLAAPWLSIFAVFVIATTAFPIIVAWIRRPSLDTWKEALLAFVVLSFSFVVATIFQSEFDLFLIAFTAWTALLGIWPMMLESIEKYRVRRRGLSVHRPRRMRSAWVWLGAFLIAQSLTIFGTLGASEMLRRLMPTDPAWSATEALYFDDRDPYVGRVISVSDQWTYIIYDDPRELRIVPTPNLVERVTCSKDDLAEAGRDQWLATVDGGVELVLIQCDDALDYFETLYQSSSDEETPPFTPEPSPSAQPNQP